MAGTAPAAATLATDQARLASLPRAIATGLEQGVSTARKQSQRLAAPRHERTDVRSLYAAHARAAPLFIIFFAFFCSELLRG